MKQGYVVAMDRIASIWHDFDQVTQSVDENIAMLASLHELVGSIKFQGRRREAIKGGFLEVYTLRGSVAGSDFAIPACFLADVENNRIVKIEEYVNPQALPDKLSPEQQAAFVA